jgi:hypothetical protein
VAQQKKAVKVSYQVRWGHPRMRVLKGHPKRAARRQRALARQIAAMTEPNHA